MGDTKFVLNVQLVLKNKHYTLSVQAIPEGLKRKRSWRGKDDTGFQMITTEL